MQNVGAGGGGGEGFGEAAGHFFFALLAKIQGANNDINDRQGEESQGVWLVKPRGSTSINKYFISKGCRC